MDLYPPEAARRLPARKSHPPATRSSGRGSCAPFFRATPLQLSLARTRSLTTKQLR